MGDDYEKIWLKTGGQKRFNDKIDDYEIRREFAPYIGINWQRKLGQTADLTHRNGEDADIPAFVAGIGFWF